MGHFTGLGDSNEGIMSCLLNLSNKILIKRGRFTKYFSVTLPLQEQETIRLITYSRWTMTAVMKSSLHSIIRGTEAKARLHWFQADVWHCAGESLYESQRNVIKGLCFKWQLPGSSSLLSPSIPVKPKNTAHLCVTITNILPRTSGHIKLWILIKAIRLLLQWDLTSSYLVSWLSV